MKPTPGSEKDVPRAAREKDRTQESERVPTRGGVPLLPSRGEVITMERVRRIMDQEGV
jgi:hypothetical protein